MTSLNFLPWDSNGTFFMLNGRCVLKHELDTLDSARTWISMSCFGLSLSSQNSVQMFTYCMYMYYHSSTYMRVLHHSAATVSTQLYLRIFYGISRPYFYTSVLLSLCWFEYNLIIAIN